LQRIDKILNNIPATVQQVPPMKSKRVTFDKLAKPPKEIPSPNKVINNQHPSPRVPNKIPTQRVSSPLRTITKAIIDKPILNNNIKIQKPIKQERNHCLSKQGKDKKSMNHKIAEPKSHSELTCKSDSRNILNMLDSFATTKFDSTSTIGN
jgi:hypothetical protein